MTDDPPRFDVVGRFRADLMTSSPRRVSRYIPIAAVSATGAALAIAVFFGLGGGGTEQALAITREADFIVVRLADAAAGPQKLTDELHEAGIDATVLVGPTVPERVGTWVQVSSPRVAGPSTNTSVHDPIDEQAEARKGEERLRGVVVEGTEVRIPVDIKAPLVLIVGRDRESGEQPMLG